MRVLHTSDWHLGRSFHGVDILDHHREFIDWLVTYVESERIDLVIVAGDVYDRAVPSLAAVGVWEDAVVRLTRTCPVLVTSGNHDSPTRLGFAGALLANAGLHLRTSLSSIADPLVVVDDDVTLAVYGLPYLEPDLHREALDAERSHTAVLQAAMRRVRDDLASRQGVRSIVAGHAFITGGGDAVVSDSERDLRVGGIGDAPAGVFDGVDYVALGHLHGAQAVVDPTVRYSGSPLAFSFSEQHHVKSVTVLDVPATGPISVTLVPTPVPRPLITLTGTLQEVLDDPATASYADHWVRVRLTDARRPDDPMGRLRAVLPHAVELTFERSIPDAIIAVDAEGVPVSDPLAIAEAFVEHVTSTPPDEIEQALLREAVERVRIDGVSR